MANPCLLKKVISPEEKTHAAKDYTLQCSDFENTFEIFVSEQTSQINYRLSTEVKMMKRIAESATKRISSRSMVVVLYMN